MIRRLASDTRAATAIEYALIAGLLALGIVGSLVTTKGSLNSVFGGLSNKMGSASSTQSATAGPVYANTALEATRQSFWQSKTLSGSPTVNGNQTKFVYTDGTQVVVTNGASAPGKIGIYIVDPNSRTAVTARSDASGVNEYTRYDAYSDAAMSQTTTTIIGAFNSTTQTTSTYSNGTYTGASSGPATAQFLATADQAGADAAYFKYLLGL